MSKKRNVLLLVIFGILVLVAGGVYGYINFFSDRNTETSTKEGAMNKPENLVKADLSEGDDGLSKSTAIIKTKNGNISFKFFPKDAPKTVERIVTLINQGFYSGLTFHRVVPGFVVQGGDPDGNGTGGSGVKLNAEFNQRRHIKGAVAMARSQDPNSADSQFYIVLEPQPHLDGNYTVFGQVTSGMDVVEKIIPGDKMLSVYIE